MLVNDEEERKRLQEETALKTKNDFIMSFGDNEFEQQQKDNASDTLKRSFSYAAEKDPEQHSSEIEMARNANVPVAMVEDSPEDAAKLARHKFLMDFEPENSPVTAKLLANPENAAVAQDDIGTLEKLEMVWGIGADIYGSLWDGDFEEAGNKALTAGVMYALEKDKQATRVSDLGRSTVAGAISGTAGIPTLFGEVWGEGEKMTGDVMNYLSGGAYYESLKESSALNEAWDKYGISGSFKTLGRDIKRFEEVVNAPKERRDWINDVAHGMGLMGTLVLTANVAGAGASTAMMFGMGAEQQLDAMNQAGYKGDFFGYETRIPELAIGGAITTITEKFGLERIMKLMPKGMQTKFNNVFTEVLLAGGAEALSEVAEGVMHRIFEQVTYNEDVEIFDWEGMKEEARTAGTVGALFKVMVESFAPNRGRTSFSRHKVEQDRIDDMLDAIKESTLQERNPSVIREHIENLIDESGQDGEIFIPAEDAAEALEGMTLNQNLPEIKNIYDQIPDALKVGGDIIIPTAVFMEHFTEETIINKIRQDIRLSGDTFTQREAESMLVEQRNDLKQMMEDAIKHEETKKASDEIVDKVASQLIASGRMSSRNARLNAKMISAYVTTQAVRHNKTPQEIFDFMNLDVQGSREAAVETSESGVVLTQDFGDLRMMEERTRLDGTKVLLDNSAQNVWNKTVKRRQLAITLKDCING